MTDKPLRYAPGDLLPATGFPEPRPGRGREAATAARIETFLSIFGSNPVHLAVFRALDAHLAAATEPGVRKYALRIIGGSGAGKSRVCDQFIAAVEARGTYPAGSRPVVRAELEQACTVKRMWSAILRAYGDGFAAVGDEEQLRRRVHDAVSRFGTRLVIIDETQHLAYRSRDGSAPTDAIKRFLDQGTAQLALVGVEEARQLLQTNVQLVNRMVAPVDIRPLDLTDADQRTTFAGWVKRFDAALVEARLFDRPSGLADDRTLSALGIVSGGYLGRVANVLRLAQERAFLREAGFIEPCDLSFVCAGWAVGQGLVATDPFRAMVREEVDA